MSLFGVTVKICTKLNRAIMTLVNHNGIFLYSSRLTIGTFHVLPNNLKIMRASNTLTNAYLVILKNDMYYYNFKYCFYRCETALPLLTLPAMEQSYPQG